MSSTNDKMTDESKLLIDTSSDNNSGNETISNNVPVDNRLKVSTINENIESSSSSKNNKFLVVKLNNLKSSPNTNNNDQTLPLMTTPSQSFPISQISSVNSINVDTNNKNSQKNKNQLSNGWDFDDNLQNDKNASIINEDFSEDEDVFEGELLNNFYTNNINNANHNKDYREMEGQDTITSLTNNVYKRQLEKIKRKASLRKSSASSSSNQTLNNINQDGLSSSSNSNILVKNSSPISGNTPIMAIKNLFKSQDSLNSKKTSSINSFLLSVKSNTPINSINGSQFLSIQKSQKETEKVDNTDKPTQMKRDVSNKSISIEQNNLTNETNQKDSSVQVNSTIIGSKQDQMFDAIKEAIDNKAINLDKQFIDNIVHIVKLQEMHLKKKKDNARRFCFFAELTVFLIILVMGVMFVITVVDHLQVIQNKSFSTSNFSAIISSLGANNKDDDEEFFFNSNYNSSSTDYATPF